MKRTVFIAAFVAVLVVAVGFVVLRAAPMVGTPAASPAYVVINTPTTVTFTVQITDPSVVQTGVNLLKVDATGKTLATVGTMHDDGSNGDAVAGDKTFTLTATVNESAVGQTYYRVSAAFKGSPQRSLSPLVGITVASVDLITAGTVGIGGGTLADGTNRLRATFAPGTLTGDVQFTLTSLDRSALPDSVVPTLPVYGAGALEPVRGMTGPSATYRAVITLPLYSLLPAGTTLVVLQPSRSGVNWIDSGLRAQVLPDGLSASFSPRSIGTFLLTTAR